MSFGPTVTALTAAQVTASTLVPLSKADARNEIECDEFLDALLLIAGAASVAARSGNVFCVRQPSGTPGTDELQLWHNGTHGYIRSMSGQFHLVDAVGTSMLYMEADSTKISLGSGSVDIMRTSDRRLVMNEYRIAYGPLVEDICTGRTAAGVLGITRNSATAGGTLSSPMLSPAELTGNTNNWNPGTARNIRVSSDGAYDITGLVAGVDGQEIATLRNVGANTLTLKNNSGSSSAGNKFASVTGADITLAANEAAGLVYDLTSAVWVVWKL